MEYYLYCDESTASGIKYTDFFGGCIISAKNKDIIEKELNDKKADLHFGGEIKWTKVTEAYCDKYCDIMRLFFEHIRAGEIKVRIMFRKASNVKPSTEIPAKDERYFKLYYEFLKHAFGFSTDQEYTGKYYVHFLLDELPDQSSSADAFKNYLCGLPRVLAGGNTGLQIRKRDIGEVKSHDHVILQCIDIILGAIQFRLNNLHKEKPAGARVRGKRTRAKEKVYNCILNEIREIHSNFNIGVSTGAHGLAHPHWDSPYEHWEFKPY